MKHNYFLTALLLLLTASTQPCENKNSYIRTIEENYSIFTTTLFISSLALDTSSYLSTRFRYALYGNHPLSATSEKIVRSMINSFNLKQPLTIRQARSMWPIITGHIFSNHDSLFVSKDTYSHIETGTPLTKELQHRLATAALMINYNYDAKLLLTCIAAPTTIWTCSFLLNKLIKKHNLLESDNTLLKNIALKAQQCEKSFTCKTFISLLIVATFIACQRIIMSDQATRLIECL